MFSKALFKTIFPTSLYTVVWLLIFSITLLKLYFHEMWLDETEPWLLAKFSPSIPDLLINKRYEGHPNLWYILLYPIAKVTNQVQVIQIVHGIISTSFTYLFFRFSPFQLAIKFLFIFSYFAFFEYSNLTRLYAIEILGIFLALTVFPHRHQYKFLYCCLLIWIINCNLFGIIFSLGLLIFEIALHVKNQKTLKKFPLEWKYLCLILTGFVISIYSIIPPADCAFAAGWNFKIDIANFTKVLTTIWGAFAPLPTLFVEFWNQNLIRSEILKVYLSLSILLGCIYSFKNNWLILLLFLFYTISILAFFYLKYLGAVRHHGHLFLFYISCLWLYKIINSSSKQEPLNRFFNFENVFIYTIFFCQVAAGIFAVAVDLVYPFGPNKDVAAYLSEKPFRKNLVVADHFHASSVAAYLNQQIYSSVNNKWQSFYQLSKDDYRETTPLQVINKARILAKMRNEPFYVLLNGPYKDNLPAKVKLVYKGKFGIIGSVQYHLFYLN